MHLCRAGAKQFHYGGQRSSCTPVHGDLKPPSAPQALPVRPLLPAADWLQDAAVKALRRLLPVLAMRPLQACPPMECMAFGG